MALLRSSQHSDDQSGLSSLGLSDAPLPPQTMTEDNTPAGELEVYEDFTIATNWERFISSIEDTYQRWTAAGILEGELVQQRPISLQKVLHHQLPQRHGPYLLTLHLDPSSACSSKPTAGVQTAQQSIAGEVATGRRTDQASSNQALEERSERVGDAASSMIEDVENALGSNSGSDSDEARQSSEGNSIHRVQDNDKALSSPADESTSLVERCAASIVPGRSADDASDLSDSAPTRPVSPFSAGGPGGMPVLNDEDDNLDISSDEYTKLRTWFGVRACVTLVPLSYSRRIMDEQEANLLLSALAVAASASAWPLPAFVPVHDALRNEFWGVGRAGRHSTVHYDTDSVHVSNPPAHLEKARGQLGVLADRLGSYSSDASFACWEVLKGRQSHDVDGPRVLVSLRRTFRLPRPGQDGSSSAVDDEDSIGLSIEEWDADCPWTPWAAHADPISDLELDVEWLHLPGSQALEASSLGVSTATHWYLHALKTADADRPAFFLQLPFRGERPGAPRQHLTFEPVDDESLTRSASDSGRVPKSRSFASMLGAVMSSKAACKDAVALGQLASLDWWERRGSDFPAAPPDAVLQDVLRDMFQAPELPAAFLGWRGPLAKDVPPPLGLVSDKWGFSRGLPRCAPASSLASRLALHVMTFSNPRAVAILWNRFVRELRFAHWETLTPLPRMRCGPQHQEQIRKASPEASAADRVQYTQDASYLYASLYQESACRSFSPALEFQARYVAEEGEWQNLIDHTDARDDPAAENQEPSSSGSATQDGIAASSAQQQHYVPPPPDLRFGLLHQKLQMLDLCIHRRRALQETKRKEKDELRWEQAPVVDLSSDDEFASCSEGEAIETDFASDVQPRRDHVPSGVERVMEGLRLLGGEKGPMREPVTQDPPVLTEDLLQERSATLAALSDSEDGQGARARLQGEVLAADMAAFKAANPGALLEDFVRWHSPRDWQPDTQAALGGRLSPRISGIWMQLWEAAPVQAAADQKPLMDAMLEGERALHWLETLPPASLWEHILPLCLTGSAACLASCTAASLPVVDMLLRRFQILAGELLDQPPVNDAAFTTLISALQHVESVIVAAESLTRRLPKYPKLVCGLLQTAGCSRDSPMVFADGLHSFSAVPEIAQLALDHSGATEQQQSVDLSGARAGGGKASAGVDWPKMSKTCRKLQRPFWEQEGPAAGLKVSSPGDRALLHTLMSQHSEGGWQDDRMWGPPMQCEWAVQVSSSDEDIPHRLYTLIRPGETRLATVCVADC